jgi:hypothetical protein
VKPEGMSGFDWWNARLDRLEPETRRIVEEAAIDSPNGSVERSMLAGCGCEIAADGRVHLCCWHMGYDSGVDAIRHLGRMSADQGERSADGQGQG